MSKTISSIAKEIGSGITPLRSERSFWESNDIPWLKTEQLGEYKIFDTNEYISKAALQNTSIKLWPIHTVSIAMYGEGKTRGNASILMSEMATNQACCNIIVDEQQADYRFLYYWIKHNYIQLRTLAAGVRKNLNSDDIKRFPFPDFSQKQQQAIADVLSSLDERITLNQSICSELEAMAKILYDYWFVQFDFPDENGKPYRTSGGAMEWCQELGREVPKGWKVRRLPEVSSVQYGFPLSTEQFSSTGNRVVRIRDIIDNSYSALTNEAVGNEYFTQEGDLLVGMDGNFQMNYWTRSGDIVNQRITRIRKSVIPIMLIKMQIQPYITAKIDTVARSTVGHLGDADFSERFILVPEGLDIEIFDAYLSKIVSLRKESQELSDLRDWLLPMLMNGQAQVEGVDFHG